MSTHRVQEKHVTGIDNEAGSKEKAERIMTERIVK
jgi:hypothetical protein